LATTSVPKRDTSFSPIAAGRTCGGRGRGRARSNVYFRSLPDGRSLTDLLNDAAIWVNYHPTMGAYGETNAVSGKEIAISERACRIGRWTVLATLIHELAHAGGAPGGADASAEEALLACGLGRSVEKTTGVDDPRTPYSPTIRG
jgi:hypothetical protein